MKNRPEIPEEAQKEGGMKETAIERFVSLRKFVVVAAVVAAYLFGYHLAEQWTQQEQQALRVKQHADDMLLVTNIANQYFDFGAKCGYHTGLAWKSLTDQEAIYAARFIFTRAVGQDGLLMLMTPTSDTPSSNSSRNQLPLDSSRKTNRAVQ